MNSDKDYANCYICHEAMGSFKNELTILTGYSERPIFILLERFIDSNISGEHLENAGICQNCFIKFNEYDQLQSKADAIQNELTILYQMNLNENYITTVKNEIKQETDANDYDEPFEILFQNDSDSAPVYEEIMIQSLPQRKSETIQRLKKPRKYKKKEEEYKAEGLIFTEVDGKTVFQCDVCSQLCRDRHRLKRHREIHTNDRNIMCPECGAKFKTIACLISHKRIHGDRPYHNCDLCTMRYSQKIQLRRHIEATHLKLKQYTCMICGKCYARESTLNKHIEFFHENLRNVVCQICGFKTHTKPKLERHMKTHTGERNYACDLCGKMFLYSYNVNVHKRYVHFKEKRTVNEEKLFCSICGKKFQKIWKVKEHMTEVHGAAEEVFVPPSFM